MQRLSEAQRIAFFSVLLNLVVTAAKGVLAFLTGSTALWAETLHSLSDLAASSATWVGIRLARLKSKTFPWGLYKVENLVSLLIAGVVFFAGYEIFREGVLGRRQVELTNLSVAIPGLGVIIAAIFLFSWFEKRKGEEFNSPALKADALHLRADSVSTLVVLVSLLGAWMGHSFLEKIATIVVILFLVRAGGEIMVDALRGLLDASVDHATLDKIRETIARDPRVSSVKQVMARNSGSVIFVVAEITLRSYSLKEAHAISEEIEEAVKEAVPGIERVTIHYEPEEKDYYLTVAVPLAGLRGEISEHFGSAPYLALLKVDRRTREVKEQITLPNPFLREEKGKGMKLAHFLMERGVDVVLTRESLEEKGPSYLFEAAGVLYCTITHRDLAAVIEDLEELVGREEERAEVRGTGTGREG
ncbi:cation diffusion facilitator family transporter [Ammonifex degensii KC4]|uniref:Cation diffusion facilitator family transporter n=1 Tax=Ammonifex degensii (strain DSM 10501 / KC4) TaxID=429009 RepID=C9R7V7_AMMDK|nr:cation diffusion facilitator family transporter [Ammonifex degensii]ACX52386.1 cation diffusion facilitator family transporter [Ammonifex degensii KC4]